MGDIPAVVENAGAESQDPIITTDNNRIRVVSMHKFPETELVLRSW